MERATLTGYLEECSGNVERLRNGFFGMRVYAPMGKGRDEHVRSTAIHSAGVAMPGVQEGVFSRFSVLYGMR